MKLFGKTGTSQMSAPIVQGYEVKPQTAASSTTTSSAHNYQRHGTDDRHAPGSSCRDAIWAVLFYVHLGGMAALTAVFAPQATANMASNMYGNERRTLRFLQDNNENDDNSQVDIDPAAVLSVIVVAGVLSFAVSTLAMGFMMHFAESLIRISLWFNILLFAVLALLSLAGGVVAGALIMGFFCALSCYYAYCVWSRIPFAASNLVTATTAVRANLGLAVLAYGSLLLMFAWSVWWSLAAASTLYVLGDCDADGACNNDINGGILFALFVSYYWTAQVITNVVHVTTAGTVGHWWHIPQHEASSGCCAPAVRHAYGRSMTTSFGSICLGSLIVALIQAVREMVHQARDSDDGIIMCCAECLLGCIESLVEYFNKWAFVYVGLYNMSFMESGAQVMNLFRSRGWTAIIADSMVDTVLFMVSLAVGAITALLALVVGAAVGMAADATLGIAFALGFIVGYVLCSTLFSLISSAVNTVIVCYAESPAEFDRNHPELSRQMRASWRQAWPAEFAY